VLGAEGAVLLLEKLSPALEHVDSSSDAVGTAVHHAIQTLIPIIALAPAGTELRGRWLDRLWQAVQDDDMPYIENLTVSRFRYSPSAIFATAMPSVPGPLWNSFFSPFRVRELRAVGVPSAQAATADGARCPCLNVRRRLLKVPGKSRG
jgi:hypothetical protein